MSYTATIWTNGITAKALNHLEGQYAAAKEEIDVHDHPSVHYLKAESDAKFFPIASGMDADTVDGYHASDLMGFQLPVGIITMHRGDSDDFSNGYLIADTRWHICDGGTYNGIKTPDMRGYFPKCPNSASTTGTGGASSAILTGDATVGDHTLTVAEIPSHYHKWTDRYYTGSGACHSPYMQMMTGNTYTVSGRTTNYNHDAADEAHNHGTKEISFNSISLTPKWKAYYFICKVAE
jgi:microcystin-dependent protein